MRRVVRIGKMHQESERDRNMKEHKGETIVRRVVRGEKSRTRPAQLRDDRGMKEIKFETAGPNRKNRQNLENSGHDRNVVQIGKARKSGNNRNLKRNKCETS